MLDHYRHRYGEKHTYWLHEVLTRSGRNLSKYRYNYLFKAFLAYNLFLAYKKYRYIDSMTYPTMGQRLQMYYPIGLAGGAFLGVCLLI